MNVRKILLLCVLGFWIKGSKNCRSYSLKEIFCVLKRNHILVSLKVWGILDLKLPAHFWRAISFYAKCFWMQNIFSYHFKLRKQFLLEMKTETFIKKVQIRIYSWYICLTGQCFSCYNNIKCSSRDNIHIRIMQYIFINGISNHSQPNFNNKWY